MNIEASENPLLRWVCSGVIALILILLCLVLMTGMPSRVNQEEGPLMEIDYVALQPNVEDQPRKEIVKVKVRRNIPEVQQPGSPEPQNIQQQSTPIESADAQLPDLSATTGKVTPTALQTPEQPVRITSAADLDNTDFSPLFNPKPDYPAVALSAHITGFVDLDIIVNEQGKVESFTVVETRGHQTFALETAKVLPRWRFPPPRIDGQKVRVQYRYRVNFTLN